MTNCGLLPLAFGLCPGLIPACCCWRGNGVIEILGVEPLLLLLLFFEDFPLDELLNDGKKDVDAGFRSANF